MVSGEAVAALLLVALALVVAVLIAWVVWRVLDELDR
jgi:hypothetical protein